MTTLQPLGGSSSARSFAYYGERSEWLVALSQHRDSDALDRSNWRVIVPPMLTDHPADAAVESFSNWAVGWSEVLLVRPGTPAADAAQVWADKLEVYPLADEDDYAEMEWDDNHPDGYCFADADAECHLTDDSQRILDAPDAEDWPTQEAQSIPLWIAP